MSNKNNPKIVFIGGVGRCGTSILREMLGKDHRISVLDFEHRMLIDPDGVVEFLKKFDSIFDPYSFSRSTFRLFKQLRLLNSDLRKMSSEAGPYVGWNLGKHFPEYDLHLEEFESEVYSMLFHGTWAGQYPDVEGKHIGLEFDDRLRFVGSARKFFNTLVSNRLERDGKEYFVEDSTWNLFHINELRQIAPNSNFVHIIRNPVDNVSSLLQQRWMPTDLLKCVDIFKRLIKKINISISSDQNIPIFEIPYEELVLNKHKTLEALLYFLNIDACHQVQNFTLSARSIGRASLDFDSSQLTILNELLSDEMKEYERKRKTFREIFL